MRTAVWTEYKRSQKLVSTFKTSTCSCSVFVAFKWPYKKHQPLSMNLALLNVCPVSLFF